MYNNTIQCINELLSLKNKIEEKIALLLNSDRPGVFVIGKDTDSWILVRYDGCSTQYVGNLPDGGTSINWPSPQFLVLSSAKMDVYSPYTIDAWDLNNLEPVLPGDYPLYLGDNVTSEFEEMVKSI